MLRFGPEASAVVVVAMPLFEEANRVRAFAMTLCRLLADRGVASVLPDLPGQGESLVPLEKTQLPDLWNAFAAASASVGTPHSVAIRGGALVTLRATCASSWIFAPVDGAALVRELQRTRDLTQPDAPSLFDVAMTAPAGTIVEAAGNRLSSDLLNLLVRAVPARPTPSRLVRLDSDRGEATHKVPGSPLWRRAEPGNDPALAALLADDIVEWIAACEG